MSAPRRAKGPSGLVPRARSAVPEWVAPALKSVLGQVALTHAEVGDRFPLFADPDTGRRTTTGRGSWTGGFWAGLLWLRARYTEDEGARAAAAKYTGRLADWVHADTATRGLIFWYGTALADTAESAALRERAARACRDAYDAELGLVPWGSAFGGPRLMARVDGVPGMVPLLATVDTRAAEAHLRRHLELCLGEDSFAWSWRYERPARSGPARGGWVPCDDPPPGWSRGRAWLLLAVADAVHHLDADDLADVTRHLIPPRAVPSADATRPGGPLDTSAAAITAVALLKLGRREQAVQVLEELVRTHLSGDGRLLDGCYDLTAGTATRHELIWGDFFLAYALAALTGLVDANEA
ncbi:MULTISPECIES: sugar ABC transporter permease [unclassified Streptomyces]|uniref:sugar ABC transporter permease n=1 Tax=unclassified Streptomyces TaxID=2593676 RepID=UPI0036E4FD0F